MSWRLLHDGCEREIPDDPYGLSSWPVRTVEGERAEIRYQMHTRNLQLIDFVRPLARAAAQTYLHAVNAVRR